MQTNDTFKLTTTPDMLDMMCTVYKDSIHIEDSWKIESASEMKSLLLYIKERYSNEEYFDWFINTGKISDMATEWQAHNMLFECGYKIGRTKDVDLNKNGIFVKFGYKVLAFIYKKIM